MSNWTDLNITVIKNQITFPTPAQGTRSSIQCVNGEIATWEYDQTDEYGDRIFIYDSTTGEDVQVAYVYALPGRDLFCGLFSSGAIPTAKITNPGCLYYRVDY